MFWFVMGVVVALFVTVAVLFVGMRHVGWFAAASGLLIVARVYFAMASTTIEVGVDGILLRPPWGQRPRFIAIASLEHCAPTKRGVRLRYYNGVEEILVTGEAGGGLGGVDHVREALYAEILDAMDAWTSNDSSVNASTRVARGERSAAEWALALRSLRAGSDYRSTDMRDEDLWLVLESAAHPEESRAAAAVVLRAGGDEAKKRIRIAAESSASPRLRVALEAASDSEARPDEEILASMDEAPQSKKTKKTMKP